MAMTELQLRKVRARRVVRARVARGVMPRVTTLACHDCGGQAKQYDHYLGYDRDVAAMVQAVCFSCHGKRNVLRGETKAFSNKGERQHKAKLDASRVRGIIALAGVGFSYSGLAKMYRVDASTIASVVNGKTWTHISRSVS